MTNTIRSLAATFLLAAVKVAPAAPDREAFALENPTWDGIPPEAFELMDDTLELEVWAKSPLVYSPVSMDCDALGRMWVTEGIDYNQKPRVEAGQSIIVVEDKDGDGTADSSHVFVTEKVRHAPLGIAVFDNKIVLSATPDIIVYTDVDRDARFDPAIDKREVFLTGFKNNRHDHTLHAVVGAPSGQWHFSFGNCGADIKTKDGRHFLSGCYYGNPEAIGKPSSDGHLYVGGLSMRINPDGTGLAVTGENMRNPHDMRVTAYGDILQSDNDDPAHARISWVMEYGNMGYADLGDGSRSWEEVAKTWEEPKGWNKNLRYSRSHWRENYPGACPPGSIYGAGSPTGNEFVEDGTLGLAGTYLVSCMVRKEVMATSPKPMGAGIEMGKPTPFLRLKEDERGRHFLPTDVQLGIDGSLFVSDFYNDTSRRTNQVSGTIYRITRKEPAEVKPPAGDFKTPIVALQSPVANVRSHAASLLVAGGEPSLKEISRTLEWLKSNGNLALEARCLWVAAQLGEKGRTLVEKYLDHSAPMLRITAYRALHFVDREGLLIRASGLARDESSAVRREVALSLRDIPFADCGGVIEKLINKYDGTDRYYLEALGIACSGKETEAYRIFVAGLLGDPAQWTKKAKNLAWRLHTPEAIAALDECIRAQEPPVDEFRHLAMAFASFRNDGERAERKARLLALAALPAFAAEDFQITVEEIIAKDLNDLKGEFLAASSPVPKVLGAVTEVSSVDSIAALEGDATRGAALAANCLLCHRVAGAGVGFGPELTDWGQGRTIAEIVKEIVDPDYKFAHGYEKPVRLTKGKHVAEGLMTNYSWHAGSLKIKLMGGETKKILFRRGGVKVENLKESLMPSAAEMGLSDQDVRDIAEYLKTLERGAPAIAADDAVPPDGRAAGWQVLTGEDFENVNCHDDTWRWEGGHAFCNGRPTGVIRYREPLVNFEFLCEWMHKKKGGNSGVFVWATPKSIATLAAGQGRLPHGIEVQVLDLGYAEVYTKQHKKPADWFTSHGDVFPVGPIKMRPFPPVAPNGRRSFPSKETTRGINEWNHYYVRAVDGEVRLWVNGEEVSGGDGISPAHGFLCLESEGAPIEFRNIRLRELPSEEKPEVDLESLKPEPIKPVSMKGHPMVGTWFYGEHSREITEEGWCTLKQGDDVIWKRRCISKTENSIVLEGNLTHVLEGDVLNIENRYRAKKK